MTTRRGSAVVDLPSDLEIVITRTFDAPAHLVFEVWTTPAHVRRWWSSRAAPLTVCEIDLRLGGRWRYVTRDPDGVELGWTGVYQEIRRDERIVTSEVFEAHPDAAAVTTLALAEHHGVTELTITVVHRTKANRDGHVLSGMEAGLQRSLDRIDHILDGLLDDRAAGARPPTRTQEERP